MTSKLKTDILETVSGSGTIALTNQLSGMTSASVPAGSILQTLTANYNSNIDSSTSSDIEATSALRVSITPFSSSSRFLVTTTYQVTVATGNTLAVVKAKRSTDGGSSFADLTNYQSASDNEAHRNTTSSTMFDTTTQVYLDVPNTTNALIYSLFLNSNGTIRLGDNGGGARLIIQEIKG
jgi:hypothetical protein